MRLQAPVGGAVQAYYNTTKMLSMGPTAGVFTVPLWMNTATGNTGGYNLDLQASAFSGRLLSSGNSDCQLLMTSSGKSSLIKQLQGGLCTY